MLKDDMCECFQSEPKDCVYSLVKLAVACLDTLPASDIPIADSLDFVPNTTYLG